MPGEQTYAQVTKQQLSPSAMLSQQQQQQHQKQRQQQQKQHMVEHTISFHLQSTMLLGFTSKSTQKKAGRDTLPLPLITSSCLSSHQIALSSQLTAFFRSQAQKRKQW